MRIIVLVGLCLFATACGMACDTWACDNDIWVKLASPVTSPSYIIEVLMEGAQPGSLPGPKTVNCSDSGSCGLEPVQIHATLNVPFTVRITTDASSKDTEFKSVRWTSSYKDNCHDCRTATITALAP